MDDTDRRLLSRLQMQIPIEPRPFEFIAKMLGTDGGEILLRIRRLKDEGVIRQMSAIFDVKKFGYRSQLVAMSFMEELLDEGASIVNEHPGVVQSSKRDHLFNFWFTISLPASESMTEHLKRLHVLSGSQRTLILPIVKMFKSSVEFERIESQNTESQEQGTQSSLTSQEMAVIQKLHEDFPLSDEPYRDIALQLNIDENIFMKMLESLRRRGYLKRIAPVLDKKTERLPQEGLIVWRIPEERREEVGIELAHFQEVQSCFERMAYPEFPFSIYTSVDSNTPESCERVAKQMMHQIGDWRHLSLPSLKIYKRERLKLFSENYEAWHKATEEQFERKAMVNALKES